MLIKVTIDRFEGDKAVMITSAKETIIWPKKQLPEKSQEGTVLRIALAFDSESEGADQKLAKDILNEILNSSQSK